MDAANTSRGAASGSGGVEEEGGQAEAMLALSPARSGDEEADELEDELDGSAIEALDADFSGRGGVSAAPADWSRPLAAAAAQDDDEEMQVDDEEGDGAEFEFMIDNNPDMSLLGAASPDRALTEQGAGSAPAPVSTAAAVVPDPGAEAAAAALAGGGSAQAGSQQEQGQDAQNSAADATSNGAVGAAAASGAQHLAGPGEHVLTNGLLLPTNVILGGEDLQSRNDGDGGAGSGAEDLGDYEQLDAARTGPRYYEEEKEEERNAKRVCPKCDEPGHLARNCPHMKCLKCGAMDEHSTRACPLALQCFRCGQVGHMSKDCKNKAAPGSMSRECERCGSGSHPAATCPTHWRIYVYHSAAEYAEARQLKHDELQRELHEKGGTLKSAAGKQAASEGKGKGKSTGAGAGEGGQTEHDEVNYGKPRRDWDPAMRWCYTCGSQGNHWGDDCPRTRTGGGGYNRGGASRNGEPSIFSERISRLGPFAHELEPGPPIGAGLTSAGLPANSTFDFEIGPGASMHLSADPSSVRGPDRNRATGSWGFGSSSRDRDRRGGGSGKERDRDRDRDRGGARDRRGRADAGRWEGRAGYANDRDDDYYSDDDDWFASRGDRRSSKRSKTSSGAASSSGARDYEGRRRRDDDDDEDDFRDDGYRRSGSGSKSGRSGGGGGGLLDRISGYRAGSPNRSQSHGGKGKRSRGARDDADDGASGDDDDARANGAHADAGSGSKKKGKGKADRQSPSRTLGASGVIVISDTSSEDDTPLSMRRGRRAGSGRTYTESDFEELDNGTGGTGGSYASPGRFQLGGPTWPVGPGPQHAGSSGVRHRGPSRMSHGGPTPEKEGNKKKKKKNKKGKSDEQGKPAKQGSAKASHKGQGSGEGSANGAGGGGGKRKGRKPRSKKSKGSGFGGGGEGKAKKEGSAAPSVKRESSGAPSVKKERSATPSVKKEFKPLFRGSY
ncbi:hypothetical protein V8E36_006522 [Tilletia maclaganii]